MRILIGVFFVALGLAAPRAAVAAIGPLDGCARDNMRHFALTSVHLLFTDRGMTFRTQADAQGCFRVWLPQGRHDLSVITTGMFIGTWSLPRAVTVIVVPGSPTHLDLLLQWHSELEDFRRSPLDLLRRSPVYDSARVPDAFPMVAPGMQAAPPGIPQV